jgi:hypothetical protein
MPKKRDVIFIIKATKYMKTSHLKKMPSKRTRLTYAAYIQLITSKNGLFLAIIRSQFDPDLAPKNTYKLNIQNSLQQVGFLA